MTDLKKGYGRSYGYSTQKNARRLGRNTDKPLKGSSRLLISSERYKDIGNEFDIILARQCMDKQLIECKNKQCLNKSCPLNKQYD